MHSSTFAKRLRISSYALGALLVGCAATNSDDGTTASAAVNSEVPDPSGVVAEPGHEGDTTKTPPVVTTGEASPTLPEQWPNHGSADCANHANSESVIYKYQYDANTVILRENKCFNFEANFIYLLFGHDKVLMQDTGSIPQGYTKAQFTAAFPIRDTVESIITDWLAAHPNADGTVRTRDSMQLLVTHSHSHGDHVSGDYQFVNAAGTALQPYTSLVGYSPAKVAAFFGITDWPNKSASVDLGGRVLDVLPIPGHEDAHVAVYDHGTNLLLSGDTLYPGHLFVSDWTAYRASTKRLSAWMKETDADGKLVRPAVHVVGNHIEKRPTTGQASFYPYPTWFQSPERKLELTTSDIDLLATTVDGLGLTSPHRETFLADFAIDPQ